MIMRFRPANISLINRRHYLPRLLLILSSKTQMQKRPQRFEGVDRVTPYQGRVADNKPGTAKKRTSDEWMHTLRCCPRVSTNLICLLIAMRIKKRVAPELELCISEPQREIFLECDPITSCLKGLEREMFASGSNREAVQLAAECTINKEARNSWIMLCT